MAMSSYSSPAERELARSEMIFDCIPDEVLEIILSHMPCARDVMMASVTCRKWHEVTWNYLYRLKFIESDFVSRRKLMRRSFREKIILKVVLKMKSLRELSISMEQSVGIWAGPLIRCLQFTKKSLTSFTLHNRIRPNFNILDSLGGSQSKLKHLEWEPAFIPTINRMRHCFQSLVSLSLGKTTRSLVQEHLEKLLSICPSLASLTLKEVNITLHADATCPVVQLKSSSLMALSVCGGFKGIDHLVLYMERLDSLVVEGIKLQSLKLVQENGCGLRSLKVENAMVTSWDWEESIETLSALDLSQGADFAEEWPRYYCMLSRASNLQRLRLKNCMLSMSGYVNLNEITASFPALSQLALIYEHASQAFEACSSAKSLTFERLAFLELSAVSIDEPFALWIAEFLPKCPCLKRLQISGEVFHAKTRFTKPLCKFNAALIDIMRPYPQVKVVFDLY